MARRILRRSREWGTLHGSRHAVPCPHLCLLLGSLELFRASATRATFELCSESCFVPLVARHSFAAAVVAVFLFFPPWAGCRVSPEPSPTLWTGARVLVA